MSATAALYARLAAATAVTAIVGTNIEPAVSKQTDNYPCVVYEQETAETMGQHSGSSGLATAVIAVDCVATTYTAADTLAAAVRAALDFQKGTWGGVIVQGAFVDDETENFEEQGNETLYYGVTLRVTIIFQL